MSNLLSVILLFGIFSNIESSRILAVYPCPSISHQVVFRPLTLELIKRGHDVTVVTTDPMFSKEDAPANLTEVNFHEVAYGILRDVIASSVTGMDADLLAQAVATKDMIYDVTEKFLQTDDFQNLLKNSAGYDLIFIEALFTPMLAISHIFKAPIILFSSFGPFVESYQIMGAPTQPLLYHNMYSQRLYNLTLWEKFNELYNQLYLRYAYHHDEEKINEMLKRLFRPDTPTLAELKNNVDLLFVNIHNIWEGNYPMPPTVIHLGGLHQKPQKPLPKDLQQYLDTSNNGVIFFSFGTNVILSLLPQEKLRIFKKVLSELPYNVLWKIEDDSISKGANNIKTFKWLPQADLLRHPNVKLFITQGGLQSTDEAITAGVPLIGVPILGDQWYNVEKYLHHKIGLKLNLADITEENLKSAILEVIQNKSYRDNIVRLRSLMHDESQSPIERAVWWTEYVLRHGGAKHLRSPAANISWAEYYELDLLVVISSVVFIALALLFLFIRLTLTCISKLFFSKKKLKTM